MDSMERIMELAKKKAQAPAQRRQSKDKIHSYGKEPLQVGRRRVTNNGLQARRHRLTWRYTAVTTTIPGEN